MSTAPTASNGASDSGITCRISLPSHVGTRATWRDRNHPELVVCDRHRSQYEERAEEFGPFDWEAL